MIETLDDAKEELKRVDHLIYVSLKYTRTVDVIQNVIERWTNASDLMIAAMLKKIKKEKKLKDVPKTPIERAELLKSICAEDKEVVEYADLFLLLRKLNKMPCDRSGEFRRNVTMTVKMDGKTYLETIDTVMEHYKKSKNFLDKIEHVE